MQKLNRISDINTEFDKWYTDVVLNSGLMDYGHVKGTMIIKPYAWKMWELIQQGLNKKFAKEKVENISFPFFIPKSLIDKEKSHIKGFAPEILTVTKYGTNQLEEPFYIRPTSEALFMDQFKKEVHSFRDLPIKWNQWCSVVRWEKKTRPFLRSSEFHWQEGHTVHASSLEAKNFSKKIAKHYKDFIEEELAIPLFSGKKSDFEKFAGAKETYTVEAIMKNGKALQSATSHFFHDSFAKAYNIKFQDKNGKTQFGHTTSWGLSTRIIGAIIMAHGDEKGLVLPPKIAPIQVIILPLNQNKDDLALTKAKEIAKKLKSFRVSIDSSDKRLGFKSANAEIKGIPIRIEIGNRDLAKNEITIATRCNGKKHQFNLKLDLKKHIKNLLNSIHEEMYKKAIDIKEAKTKLVSSYSKLKEQILKGYALANWCKSQDCEKEIKEETGATTRCMPLKQDKSLLKTCIKCNLESKTLVYFALAY